MYASGAISMERLSIAFCTRSRGIMSSSASYSGRRYGSTFSYTSPGRNPRLSPASTAGRASTMRRTRLRARASTAIATARYVFPVPAGPMPITMSCCAIACRYSRCPAVFAWITRRSPGRMILYSPSGVRPDGEYKIILPGLRRVIQAKTAGQREYLQAIAQHDIVIGIGPAGTGKTYLAVAMAVDALARKRVRRIVLARPAVEAGENLGFLPGDLHEKVDPYLRPLYDALEDMMPRDRVQKAIDNRTIEIAPLAYMRGRTLSDAFVILDEAQNATGMQMKMFLTRLGVNSRAVITGDKTQIDLANREDSGLLQVERILPGIDGIGFCYLGDGDVVRHRLVRDIIRAYAEDAQG